MKRKDGPLAPRARWLLAAAETTAGLAVAILTVGLLADVASGIPYAAIRMELIAVIGLLFLQLAGILSIVLSLRSAAADDEPSGALHGRYRPRVRARVPAARVALSLAMSVAIATFTLMPSGVVTSTTVLALDPTPAPTPDPTPAPTPDPTPAPTPDPTPAPDPTATPDPGPTPAPSPEPTPATPEPTATPTPEPTATPTPSPTPTPPAVITIAQTSDAPATGLHRIDPGSRLAVSIAFVADADVPTAVLQERVPPGWAIADVDGGAYDPIAGTVSWSFEALPANLTVRRSLILTAPSVPFPDGSYVLPATFSTTFDQDGAITGAPDVSVIVAPEVAIPGSVLSQVTGSPPAAVYLPPDAPILDEQRFETFRVRFDVGNPDSEPITWTPRLEFRPVFGGAWTVVPAASKEPGVAFYVSGEWVTAPGGGTMPGPDGEVIDATSLGAGDRATADFTPSDGYHSMAANPIPAFRLPAASRSAVEFSVRATVDAAYLTTYEFRLTDASTTFAGAVQPFVRLGSQPDVELSPGQRAGTFPGDPVAAALRLGPPAPEYALLAPGALGPAGAAESEPVHGPYLTLTSDACGACHRAHTATGPSLLPQPSPQYGLCVTCHAGGTAGAADVASRYATAPTNDPATRSYYRHDPTQVAGHTSAETDVFAGVSERHAECADCHQPHRAAASPDASPGPDGYAVSGRLQGATGVSVANGAAGQAPTYALVSSITTEYQLCFKCHSGYTVLPDNTGLPPSQAELDKGVEFNPANLSYHPVEAPGTNQTTQMDASLAGTSPYKLWTFTATSTIRCLNCHADSNAVPPAGASPSPAPPSDGSSLPVHTSQNRGILIQNYRDRVLKGPIDAYDANDFALCFSCHAEAPFRDTSGNERPDTNFRYHGFHVSDIIDKGNTGTSIDTAGDGGGLAICSECHFRIHSTTYAVNGQTPGERLVNFAPNVTAATGLTLTWIKKTPVQDGSCTLKCHAAGHRPENY